MMASKGGNRSATWKLLGIEGLLIMFSVFMGMWLQAWYETRSQAAVAERALEGVFDQAIENCLNLLNVRDYYQQVVAGDMPPEGLRVGHLRNEAWEFLLASESLMHLDYPVARTVTAIQNEQEYYMSLVNAYTQALFNLVFADPVYMEEWRHPEAERMIMSDLLLSQDRLFEHYGQLIELLGDRDAYRDIDTAPCLAASDGNINEPS